MGDISLDMIKDFYSLKPLAKANTLTDAKITGRHWDMDPDRVHRQEFKLAKKTPQR